MLRVERLLSSLRLQKYYMSYGGHNSFETRKALGKPGRVYTSMSNSITSPFPMPANLIKNSQSYALKVRRIQRHRHHQPRNQSSTGQRDDPRREDESNLLPVYSPHIIVAERNTNCRASQTLCSRNWQRESGCKKHGDSGAKLHGEAASGRDLGDLVAEGAHDVVTVDCDGVSGVSVHGFGERRTPESETEEQTRDNENPDGRVGFGGDFTAGVGVVAGYPGADGVGN